MSTRSAAVVSVREPSSGGGSKSDTLLESISQPIVRNETDRFSNPGHRVSSTAVPTNASILVDTGGGQRDKTENGRGEGEKRDESGKEKERAEERGEGGGEREREKRELPPDPLYADPDDVHTMLDSTAGTRDTEKKAGEVGRASSKASKTAPPAKLVSESGQSRYGDGDKPGLGEDPLYAVPEQVVAKMRGQKASSSPRSSGKASKMDTATATTG